MHESVETRITRVEESMVGTRGELREHRSDFKDFRSEFTAFLASERKTLADLTTRVAVIESLRKMGTAQLVGLCTLASSFAGAIAYEIVSLLHR